MTINGKNYLFLQKRGCNFWENAPEREYSDVGNYRVFVSFVDRDGVEVCGDFAGYDILDYTKKNRPVKKRNALHADLQYKNELGTWCYNAAVDTAEYSYTLADILSFVNAISVEQYDAIKFVYQLEFVQSAGADFTPAEKIREYARKYRMETVNRYDRTILKLFTGDFEYCCMDIKPMTNGLEKVIITTSEIA